MTDQPPGFRQPDPRTPPTGFPTAGYPANPYPAHTPSGPIPAQHGAYPATGQFSTPFPAQTPSGSFAAQGGPAGPRAKRGAAVPVLAAVVVVFLAAAGLMFYLYLGAKDDVATEAGQLDQTTRSLAETTAKTDKATTTAEDTKAEVSGVTKDIASLESSIAKERKCADPVKDSLDAVAANDDAKLRASVRAMIQNC